jgi:hypothetical protein
MDAVAVVIIGILSATIALVGTSLGAPYLATYLETIPGYWTVILTAIGAAIFFALCAMVYRRHAARSYSARASSKINGLTKI